MSIPFWCVVIGGALPYVWSFASFNGRAADDGGIDNHTPRAQQAKLTGVAARAIAAHNNAFEAFPFFAASVFIAHLCDADPTLSSYVAMTWVAFRIGHGVSYLANFWPTRSLSFLLGLVCNAVLIYLAATAA